VPSFVLSARDAAGADLVDVKVTMDGTPIATTLDGRAVDVDPGLHTLVFEKADGTRVQTTAMAAERGKGKVVAVTFTGPPPSAVVPLPAPSRMPTPAPAPATEPAPPASNGSALRTVGIVTAAVGAAGLVVGGVFGGLALATKGAHCNGGVCDPGSTSTAYTQGNVSTTGFVAGGILAAAGLAMFLMAPTGGGESTRGVALAPVLGPTEGGVQLGGAW
jgi:hypothetical protein